MYEGRPLADVPPCVLEPRSSTALLDAIGRTIVQFGARLMLTPEHERPAKVFFVVVTDGHENASKEFNRVEVASMIKRQRDVRSITDTTL